MGWRPERPWFGPSPTGKIKPVAPAGYVVLFGAIALLAALLHFGQAFPHLLVLGLALGLVAAALVAMVATYGPTGQPPGRR